MVWPPGSKLTVRNRSTAFSKGDVYLCCGAVKARNMHHTENALRSEDHTRTLNNEIAELQSRVAFPQHWTPGEHQQNLDRLHQLELQKRQTQQQQQQ